MPNDRTRADIARSGFAGVLLAMLLFSQWLGMQHRIAHAGWFDGRPPAMQSTDLPDPNDIGSDGEERKLHAPHSCSLVDGTALADTVASFVFLPLSADCAKVLALWLAYQSWDAPLISFFLSRAPPAIG
jgi:hypothetical protein